MVADFRHLPTGREFVAAAFSPKLVPLLSVWAALVRSCCLVFKPCLPSWVSFRAGLVAAAFLPTRHSYPIENKQLLLVDPFFVGHLWPRMWEYTLSGFDAGVIPSPPPASLCKTSSDDARCRSYTQSKQLKFSWNLLQIISPWLAQIYYEKVNTPSSRSQMKKRRWRSNLGLFCRLGQKEELLDNLP